MSADPPAALEARQREPAGPPTELAIGHRRRKSRGARRVRRWGFKTHEQEVLSVPHVQCAWLLVLLCAQPRCNCLLLLRSCALTCSHVGEVCRVCNWLAYLGGSYSSRNGKLRSQESGILRSALSIQAQADSQSLCLGACRQEHSVL